MTARELIIQLQRFEPDTEVWLPAMTKKGIRLTLLLTTSFRATTATLQPI